MGPNGFKRVRIWPQMCPGRPIDVQRGSEMAKIGPRRLPDEAEMARHGANMAPRWHKMAPERSQLGPRWGPVGPKIARDGRKRRPR